MFRFYQWSTTQGSVVGPILFNVYISGMALTVKSPIVQFADDIKMFRAIVTIDDFLQDINLLSKNGILKS